MQINPSRSMLLPVVLVFLSCSDPSAQRIPASVTVVSGGGQSGAVAETLPLPVVVEVLDPDGKAVRGVTVTWTVSSGGGTLDAGTTTTNGSGHAQVQWTLGTTAGQNRVSAAVEGVAPRSISAVAHAGPPASMVITGGEGQVGLQRQQLGEPIAVRVHDAHGNGVQGAAVTFTPDGGSITPATVFSDMSGTATAFWTLGPAGEHNASITVADLAEELRVTAVALAADEIVTMLNDLAVSGLGAEKGQSRYFRITVPENSTRLTITTDGGPGDVDVFARHERLPTARTHGCESTTSSATERCIVENPAAGDWYVLLDAFTTYSDVTLRAAYIVGGSMAVSVSGLPQDAEASILVTGPDHFEQQLTGTTTLVALTPGAYSVAASYVRADDVVYVSAPERQDATVILNEVASISVTYSEPSGGLNLDVPRAYITQAVQRVDGSVPLVAGKDGLLRILGRVNAVSAARPPVRARIYRNGALIETLTVPAPVVMPVSHDEGTLSSTWNVPIPGSLIQPGTSLLIDVDPDNEVAEADESDNHFPLSGTPLALDVRAATTLQARLVPVVQSGNDLRGDVTDQNRDSYVAKAKALYPLPEIDVDVRAPYTFNGTLSSSYDTTWQRLLREVNALRIAEAPERYYYGVIKPGYTSGGTGLGYIGERAALGVDWPNWRAETIAHEWGHNFGRRHVNCGGPSGIDPEYPYSGGRLGHHGYDTRTNEIVSMDTHHDLLSYCSPTWSSDYTYEAVLNHRASHAGASAGGAARQPSLLVWGRIAPDGVVLEPAFQVVAAPVLPRAAGPYRLTGTNANGVTVLDVSFDAYEIDHLADVRLFAYVIPLSAMGGGIPTEMRLRAAGAEIVRTAAGPAGPGEVQITRESADRVRLQWDAVDTPVLMVRDGRTGEILSFARGGDAQVTTSAAEVEITMSDGLRSTLRRMAVPQ